MFTKKDLRNGDVLLHHNGVVSIFVESLGILVQQGGEFGLWSFKDDWSHELCRDFDIVAVRRPKDPCDCSFGAFKNRLGDRVFPEKPEPKIGDRVIVVNRGEEYSTYSEWIKRNAPSLLDLYIACCHDGDIATIVAKAPHSVCSEGITDRRTLCACVKQSDGRVFLIGVEGVRTVEVERENLQQISSDILEFSEELGGGVAFYNRMRKYAEELVKKANENETNKEEKR